MRLLLLIFLISCVATEQNIPGKLRVVGVPCDQLEAKRARDEYGNLVCYVVIGDE